MFRINNDLIFDTYQMCQFLPSGSMQIVTDVERATHYLIGGEIYEMNSTTIEYFEAEVEETTTSYTAEQLEAMTSAELKAICTELGIPTSMVKQNMIDLILGKQNET